jgi:uncharacterized protein
MLISRDKNKGSYEIREYEKGKIVINDSTYYHSVIVTSHELITNWRPQTFHDLLINDFEIIYKLNPEILLVGTGIAQLFPNPQIFSKLYEKNIGVEVMNTSAACRTFNVLMSESRNAAAALLLD